MGSDNEKLGVNGLPEMTAEEKNAGGPATLKTILVVSVILAVGVGVGFAVTKLELLDPSSAAKIAVITSLDLHFVYLAVIFFGRLTAFLNFFPMGYKEQIMRSKSGNLRANMYFYKQLNKDNNTNLTYIGLEDEGSVGCYNRANRSLNHFVENSIPVALTMVLAGYVYPRFACMLTAVFAIGRIMHQTGYSAGGYGAHGLGFGVAMLASTTLEGLVLLISLKGFDVL